MKRIVPWDLPSVNGGSQGGYTPQPTPTPTPEPQVYLDFTDAVVRRNYAYDTQIPKGHVLYVTVESWQKKDLTGASTVKLQVEYAISTISQADADTTDDIKTITSPGGDITQVTSRSVNPGNPANTAFWASVRSITAFVFNSAGDVLAQYSIPYSEGGE